MVLGAPRSVLGGPGLSQCWLRGAHRGGDPTPGDPALGNPAAVARGPVGSWPWWLGHAPEQHLCVRSRGQQIRSLLPAPTCLRDSCHTSRDTRSSCLAWPRPGAHPGLSRVPLQEGRPGVPRDPKRPQVALGVCFGDPRIGKRVSPHFRAVSAGADPTPLLAIWDPRRVSVGLPRSLGERLSLQKGGSRPSPPPPCWGKGVQSPLRVRCERAGQGSAKSSWGGGVAAP